MDRNQFMNQGQLFHDQPSKRLCEILGQFEMSSEKWWAKITGKTSLPMQHVGSGEFVE